MEIDWNAYGWARGVTGPDATIERATVFAVWFARYGDTWGGGGEGSQKYGPAWEVFTNEPFYY